MHENEPSPSIVGAAVLAILSVVPRFFSQAWRQLRGGVRVFGHDAQNRPRTDVEYMTFDGRSYPPGRDGCANIPRKYTGTEISVRRRDDASEILRFILTDPGRATLDLLIDG